MKKKPYILGIVPARNGSKRLPGKNIRLLNGRPLIDYIIKTALKSKYLDTVIVTTDSAKIRKIAVKSGASAPFLRPKGLAQDNSPVEEALRHAVLFMEDYLGHRVDIGVLLQTTSPFTTAGMIDKCIGLLLKEGWDTVVSVKQISIKREWVGFIDKKGAFRKLLNEKQCFKLAGKKQYAPSGNIYVFKRNVLFRQKTLSGKNTGAVIIHPGQSIDIDYVSDFLFAEFLINKDIKWKN